MIEVGANASLITKTEANPAAAGVASKFVHLHNHSHYSLLDGLQKVPQMLDRVAELGMKSVALTDHGTLSGTIEFYQQAKKRDLRPVIGSEIYVAPRRREDKSGKIDANPYHLVLLAYNNTGYQNLMQLVSTAHLEGFYYKPRVDRALLEAHHEGLIALSACASGEVARHILNQDLEQAEATIKWYRDTFGSENYFLEMQDHDWSVQADINKGLLELARVTRQSLVVTADSHYTHKTDRDAHEILLCVQTGKTIGDTNRMEMDMALFVSNPTDIADRFKDHPDAVTNTGEIAERCNVEIEFGVNRIPTFSVPTGETELDYLKKLSWQGLMWRYGDIAKEDTALVTETQARKKLPQAIVERADYELSVMAKMGFPGYFLIVADFINWGKNQGIIFGPGRGSAAGSIISYALNITDLDPLKYNLLFERFLNPDRISMPDIDIDIEDVRREEVIAYVTEKYGQEQVAQIITFGTMAARNAVRDTGRALGMPYDEVDFLAKKIPAPIQGRHIPLAKSIVDDPDLKHEYDTNPRSRRLIDLAQRLEGTIRSNGVHAAGVVIAPEPIVHFTPLQVAQKGGISTQYSMSPIEDLGLLKMDFLGLSNLTVIKNALRIIRKVHEKELNIAEIPLDDPKTFELLARGDTTGVFQLESAGMQRYLRELRPTVFDDIIAIGALYRPGPMAEIPRYILGKNNPETVTYDHPLLEPIFKPTYGVMVYQEQVIALLQQMAGYTPGQADLVRKAIGKKKRDIMAAEQPKFIAGCIKQGVDSEKAEALWAMIQPFADYSFNKSHAACYGLISYQTAYLKAHFPSAFMAALLTSDHGNIDRIAIEITECRRLGIEILPPDINESFLEFGVMKQSHHIRFGLAAVKNVGLAAIEAIVAVREEGGEFKTIEDFARRVPANHVNKKVMESLTKVGAFDRFGERSQILHNLDKITGYASKAQKNALSGQIDIFGAIGTTEDIPPLELELPPTAVNLRDYLQWERDLLGMYVSHHPLDDYRTYLEDRTQALASLNAQMEGRSVKVGGLVTAARKITTKTGSAMAFVKLEDTTGSVELIVFPKIYSASPDLWLVDKVLEVEGKVNTKDKDGRRGNELKIMVDKGSIIDDMKLRKFQAAQKNRPTPVTPKPNESVITASDVEIKLKPGSDKILVQLKEVLLAYPGANTVYLTIETNPARHIKLPFEVSGSPELMRELETILGTAGHATPRV